MLSLAVRRGRRLPVEASNDAPTLILGRPAWFVTVPDTSWRVSGGVGVTEEPHAISTARTRTTVEIRVVIRPKCRTIRCAHITSRGPKRLRRTDRTGLESNVGGRT